MRVAIHQPEHLPYGGFFEKMARSDVFVLLDDVPFARRGFQHRNRIGHDTKAWIKLHVKKCTFDTELRHVQLNSDRRWREKYLDTIENTFGEEYAYKRWRLILRDALYDEETLMGVNLRLIYSMARALRVARPDFIMASTLGTDTVGEERILEICRILEASEYVSDFGALHCLARDAFGREGIDIDLVGFTDHRSALCHIMKGVQCTDTVWRRCVMNSPTAELI